MLPTVITADDKAAFELADTVLMARLTGRFMLTLGLDTKARARGTTSRERQVFPEAVPGAGQLRRELFTVGTVYGTVPGTDNDAWSLANRPDAEAFHLLTTARLNARWQTVARLVEPGDTIGLRFAANTQPYPERRRCHRAVRDEIELEIRKPDHTLTFLLAVVVADGDGAYMVRHKV